MLSSLQRIRKSHGNVDHFRSFIQHQGHGVFHFKDITPPGSLCLRCFVRSHCISVKLCILADSGYPESVAALSCYQAGHMRAVRIRSAFSCRGLNGILVSRSGDIRQMLIRLAVKLRHRTVPLFIGRIVPGLRKDVLINILIRRVKHGIDNTDLYRLSIKIHVPDRGHIYSFRPPVLAGWILYVPLLSGKILCVVPVDPRIFRIINRVHAYLRNVGDGGCLNKAAVIQLFRRALQLLI